jgi:hypothetical protein
VALLSDNLVSFWQGEEASGNLLDGYGAHPLTAFNSPGSAAGKVGLARSLVIGSLQYFQAADHADFSFAAGQSFTVGLWALLTSKTADRTFVFKGTGATAAATVEYFLGYSLSFNRWRFSISNGTTIQGVQANAFGVPTLSTLDLILAWYDGSANTVNIQINNGTVTSAAAAQGPRDHTGTFSIGRDGAGGIYADGRVDQVFLSRRVYTAAERAVIYNHGQGLTLAQFLAWSPNAPRATGARRVQDSARRVQGYSARRVERSGGRKV